MEFEVFLYFGLYPIFHGSPLDLQDKYNLSSLKFHALEKNCTQPPLDELLYWEVGKRPLSITVTIVKLFGPSGFAFQL